MQTNEDDLIIALIKAETELCRSFDLSNSDERNRMETLIHLKEDLESQLLGNINPILKHQDIMPILLCSSTSVDDMMKKVLRLGEKKVKYNVKSDLFTSINDLNYDCFYYIRMANKDNDNISTLSTFPNTDKLSTLKLGEYFRTPLTTGKTLYTVIGSLNIQIDTFQQLIKGLDSLIEESFKGKPLKVAVFFNFENDIVNYEIKRFYLNLILIVLLIKMAQHQSNNKIPEVTFLMGNDQEQELFQKILRSYQRQESTNIAKTSDFKEKLRAISKKCLTQDPKYIEILKYILYILDEDDIPILLLGESGVGKSYLAKTIHELSSRGEKKFEQINCGVLTGDRLFQQIWGWEKGSFTGATNGYEGLIKRADQGTFFIDEIDRASSEVRNAILTFVENKTYEKLGATKVENAKVRLIFGSNKNLKKYIKKGQFEPDLYARIAGRIVNIPPLRERLDDIDLMVDSFLETLNEEKKTSITIDKSARDHLKTHSWPMNIRELHRYIKIIFYEVNTGKGNIIRREHLENNPFDDFSISKNDEFNELMEIIKSFLGTWDENSGKFLEEIIYPIIAKIYKDNYSSKYATKEEVWTKANNIIGISGLNHNKSSLMKYYNDFENVKEKLKLN